MIIQDNWRRYKWLKLELISSLLELYKRRAWCVHACIMPPAKDTAAHEKGVQCCTGPSASSVSPSLPCLNFGPTCIHTAGVGTLQNANYCYQKETCIPVCTSLVGIQLFLFSPGPSPARYLCPRKEGDSWTYMWEVGIAFPL